ncbi:MAG TPA: thiamine phosphate synthase [Blastocatellia bacterium]|nr:thiamine phosphate synthase [Blastocatellia bacterium]
MNKLSPLPLLYLITNRHQFAPTTSQTDLQLAAIAQAAQAAPLSRLLIQIREKDLSARELCSFVRAALQIARPHGARVLVNDRLDVALATGADGVHLRVNSLPTARVARLVNRTDFLIGVSTHSTAEATAAQAEGADFIVFGPIFPTPSKAIYGPPQGLDRLAEICRAVTLPVFALGGITMDNYNISLTQGASGIAAISLFGNPATLGSNIHMMLSSPLTPQD